MFCLSSPATLLDTIKTKNLAITSLISPWIGQVDRSSGATDLAACPVESAPWLMPPLEAQRRVEVKESVRGSWGSEYLSTTQTESGSHCKTDCCLLFLPSHNVMGTGGFLKGKRTAERLIPLLFPAGWTAYTENPQDGQTHRAKMQSFLHQQWSFPYN